jgi:hypothetical protein
LGSAWAPPAARGRADPTTGRAFVATTSSKRHDPVTDYDDPADRATFSAMTTQVVAALLLLLFIASSALGFRFGARR